MSNGIVYGNGPYDVQNRFSGRIGLIGRYWFYRISEISFRQSEIPENRRNSSVQRILFLPTVFFIGIHYLLYFFIAFFVPTFFFFLILQKIFFFCNLFWYLYFGDMKFFNRLNDELNSNYNRFSMASWYIALPFFITYQHYTVSRSIAMIADLTRLLP